MGHADSRDAGHHLSRRFTQPRLAAWLSRQWLTDGPPICLVEGFSGLGKSYLGRQVRDGYRQSSAYVEIADAQTSFEDFLLKTQGRLKIEADIGIPVGADTATAIERALRGGLLVVVDDFQNCLAPGTHELPGQFANFFHELRSQRAGRLLLLTSQSVDEDQCQELNIAQRTLMPLSPEGGGALLVQLLAARDRQDQVPANRIVELARWLGSNPRAMQALVAALRYVPLAELVGTEPDATEIGYRHVDELLVVSLEKQFVRRTMDRLTSPELQLLERLSVHRKSFAGEAITLAYQGIEGGIRHSIQELVNLFFLELYRAEYTLNPTARELALRSALRNRRVAQTAHRFAADFYLRHFKAKRVKPLALADKFMEARHHLHLSGRTTELRDLALTFALHLQRSALSQPIPEDPDDLDEQILLLEASVEQGSPSGLLNLRLARMLLQRGRDGDLDRALAETTEAIDISPGSADVWQLHLELVHQVQGLDAVPPLLELARTALPPSAQKTLSMIYIRVLRRAQRFEEALKMIQDLLSEEPDNNSGERELLYIQAIDLLDQVGDLKRAEEVIKAATAEFTADNPGAAFYRACIEFRIRRREFTAAVALLDQGLQQVAPGRSLASLYHAGIKLHIQRGDKAEAMRLLADGIDRIAPDQDAFLVYVAGATLHIEFGDIPAALALIDESQRRLPQVNTTLSLLNIGILVHIHEGDLDAAVRLGFRGLAVPQNHTVIETVLLAVYRFVHRPDTSVRAWRWWDKIDEQLDAGSMEFSQVLRLMAKGAWAEAAEAAAKSREKAVTAAIVRQEAFAFLATGDAAAAYRATTVFDLTMVWKGRDRAPGRVQSWVVALVNAVRGNARARRLISENWGIEAGTDVVATCVQLWLRESHKSRPVPSTYFPVLPKEITGMAEDLVHPSIFSPEVSLNENSRRPAVLALATEWSSAYGGLNTLNRQLCCALAAQGAKVVCMVLRATDADRRDAKDMNVILEVAVGPPGGSGQTALSEVISVTFRSFGRVRSG